MRLLNSPDSRIIKLLGRNKVEPDRVYRLSKYAYCKSFRERHYIKSTMTGGIYELSDEEWAVVDPSADLIIQGSDIEAAGLADLVSGCVLVYSTDDDYSRYRFAVTAIKAMDRSSRGVKTYTILPTTACNARCVYCYEQGMKVSTMSESTADKVIDFILKMKRSEEITLCWFGGEPLVAANIINRICTGLNEKGVSFNSRIITNASLFTPELLDTAVNVWHLKRAQVSVDGAKSDYEARKLFCSPKIHNYEYLLKTIGIMLDAGLEVTLRCNFDQGNIEGMYSFWEDINNLYGDSDKLRVYSSMLFQAQKDPSCIDLHKRYLELRTEASEKGMKFLRFKGSECKMKTNFCMADSDGKCIVIGPDGNLYNCEHLPGNTSCASIFDEDIKLGSDPRASLEADDKCRECPFLPECTPFCKHGCPDWFEYCREFKCVDTDEQIKRLSI